MSIGDAQADAAVILIEMRARWVQSRVDHLPTERQERVATAWARLRLIDKYEAEFARQKRTGSLSPRFNAEARGPLAKPEHSDGIDPEDDNVPPLSRLERDELYALVMRLPPKQRDVVKALVYDSMTQEETARAVGISQPAVSMTYERARKALRQLASHYEGTIR